MKTGSDYIIRLEDIPVMYVQGRAGEPIPKQSSQAFNELEEKLTTLKGMKFYGVIFKGEYKACVAIDKDATRSSLPHPTWVIPGGKYVRRKIPNWEENQSLIPNVFIELEAHNDYDSSRPSIEFYKSQKELHILVPVE